MVAARLAQPAPRNPRGRVPWALAAGLPTAALRQAWAHLWWSVRTHMADLHALPRDEAVGQPPRPPPRRWPPTYD
jgi:hypothetical protein